MASGRTGKDRSAQQARERARLYQAKLELHDSQSRRRRRDNWAAAIVGTLVVLLGIGGQVAYVTVGPGTPAPAPTATSTPGPALSPSPESPSATPAPQDTGSPAPTPTPSG